MNNLAIQYDFTPSTQTEDDISINSHIDKKILEDYFSFFTQKEGAEMTSYIYLDSCNYYDQLIKDSADYYLCRDHIEIIKKHKDKFKQYLFEVTDIIEIGPGSDYVVKNKTMPILSYAKNLKSYQAIDNCKQYLDETCVFVKNNTSGIEIFGVEADLMRKEKIQLYKTHSGKKCITFLGGTLANFHELQQNHCLKQIYTMLNPGDLFIITADTNQDEKSLLAAYYNIYAQNLFTGVIRYFASINSDFKKHAASFELRCSWNKASSFIDLHFVAQDDLSFHFPNYGNIIIKKGQIFKGIRAYKKTKQANIELLNKNGFEVLDVLNNSNKMQEFICQRI